MSNNNELAKKARVLVNMANILGEELTRERLDGYLRILDPLTPEELGAACDAHMRDTEVGSWWPKPAQILAKAPRKGIPGHLPGDAAWALALLAADEDATVVLTPEILQALQFARPLLSLGDEVGGRMAFKAVYEPLVQGAAAPPKWFVSYGQSTDPTLKSAAIERAVQDRLISQAQAKLLLPPAAPQESVVLEFARCLPAGNVLPMPPERTAAGQAAAHRERVRECRDAIKAGLSRRQAAATKRRQEAQERRQEAKDREEERRAQLVAQASGPARAETGGAA